MLTVVGLGGNALLERHERPDALIQRWHVKRAAQALAPLATEQQLLICHGNGPQIGLLAKESDDDPALTRAYPLDALGAQTQGMIGYWLAQELRNVGVSCPVVAVVTQTIVDAADVAFAQPTKFIGRVYGRDEAQRLAARHGWQVRPDGPAWRRVVPSPEPLRIVEQESVRQLLQSGAVVICGGGGGAPVTEDDHGRLTGVEAVVDKDYLSARLALDLVADQLLLLTDVAAVMQDFGTDRERRIDRIGVDELAQLTFPAGSMGPKVDACARFTAATGRPSAIGALTDAMAVARGNAGTAFTPGRSPEDAVPDTRRGAARTTDPAARPHPRTPQEAA